MSNALKNAVESSASTLSDLVDGARARIEDLPPLAHARRKRARNGWTSVIGLVVLAFAAMIVAKQARRPAASTTDREQ